MDGALIDYPLLDTLIAPIAEQPFEICIMLYLDSGARLRSMRHVRGIGSAVEMPVRLFVADALAFEARAAIVAHNHPSGDVTASRADLIVTVRLARALGAVGVTLLDHLVVAGPHRVSLRAGGYL